MYILLPTSISYFLSFLGKNENPTTNHQPPLRLVASPNYNSLSTPLFNQPVLAPPPYLPTYLPTHISHLFQNQPTEQQQYHFLSWKLRKIYNKTEQNKTKHPPLLSSPLLRLVTSTHTSTTTSYLSCLDQITRVSSSLSLLRKHFKLS